MNKKEYYEKLKDPRWQKKRLGILERDNYECIGCGERTKQLHVHHLKYFDGDPWDIPDDLLITLCEDCHKKGTKTIINALPIQIKDFKNYNLITINCYDDVFNIFYESNKCINWGDITGLIHWVGDWGIKREFYIYSENYTNVYKPNKKDE